MGNTPVRRGLTSSQPTPEQTNPAPSDESNLPPAHSPTFSPARFIPATIADNQFINPEYTKILERLSGWQKRAWLHGDWDIAAGQFFTNFRRDIHIIKDFDRFCATEWFGALDYGYTHYTVFLLGAKDGDGNLYVVDEHCARQWLPRQHFHAIDRMLNRYVLHMGSLERCLTGPDCFSTQYTGTSIANQYSDLGLSLRQANCDRIGGWAEILRRFGNPERGIKPTLFIHERCQKLIECLPHLQHDPNRPEDVLKVDTDEDGAGGDDAADALRYLVGHHVPIMRAISLATGLPVGEEPMTQLERTRRFLRRHHVYCDPNPNP